MGDFYFDSESRTLYGPKSEEGWTGSVNLKGDPGLDGSDGRDGKDGTDGTDGADGSQIYSGEAQPDDDHGNVGDYYLNLLTFELVGPKTADGWGTPVVLKGPQGEQGAQGEQGEPGQDGNANVIVATASLSGSSWTFSNRLRPENVVSQMRSKDLDISAITSGFENLASVVVYVKLSNHADAGYEPLPYRFYASGGYDYSVNITFQHDEENVRLFYYHESNDPDASHPNASSITVPNMDVRITLIDSSANTVILFSNEWSDVDDLEHYLEQDHRVEKRIIRLK